MEDFERLSQREFHHNQKCDRLNLGGQKIPIDRKNLHSLWVECQGGGKPALAQDVYAAIAGLPAPQLH
jgi:hypothetical protein